MGDHFVLLVDRLITESSLESALESQNRSMEVASSAGRDTEVDVSVVNMDFEDKRSRGKLVQCRICHDEDEVANMETPCSCRGSLKYAHRRCIQRWCNEKGDIICEICLQPYQPGYTAPPTLFRLGRLPLNFSRRHWEISRRDLHGTTQIVHVISDQNLIRFTNDQCSASAVFCAVAFVIMFIMILKHALPFIGMIESMEYSLPIYTLFFVRIVGMALSMYIILRTVNFLQQHRQHRQQRQREHPATSGNRLGNQYEQLAFHRQLQVARV